MNIKQKESDPHYGLSAGTHIKRRLWHFAVAGVVFYYLVPDIMFSLGPVPVYKNFVILLLFLIVAFMEGIRLVGRWDFGLFRTYEKRRISAPFWFTSTSALLVLLTPQWVAIPCIMCVVFADPVLGELRNRGLRAYPIFGWIICLPFFLIYSYPLITAIILASITTSIEIVQVPIKDKNSPIFISGILDDNFTMQVFPALIIMFFWLLETSFGLTGLIPDVEPLLSPLY